MFKVSARTVLELGSELISSDAIAFYELVKNGFDAGTKSGVEIKFNIVLGRRSYDELSHLIVEARADAAEDEDFDCDEAIEYIREELVERLIGDAGKLFDKATNLAVEADTLNKLSKALDKIDALSTVTVSDTGSGMSLEELNSIFLVLGTKSRKKEVDLAFDSGEEQSPYLGEKGIGRLSAMRLGDRLTVRTSQSGSTNFSMLDIDWSDFDDPDKMINEVEIEPYEGSEKEDIQKSGTDIRIRKLHADWNRKRVERLAADDFSLLVNPIGQSKGHRIAIYWNGDRINFHRLDKAFLSHAHAEIKGSYKVVNDKPELTLRMQISDLGFEHSVEHHIETVSHSDLAASLVGLREKRSRENKRDVNMAALTRVGSFDFELYWFNRRTLRKGRTTGEANALRNLLDQWMGVRLYRDGFRVYP